MGQPVVHFEICSKDATKATAFYQQLFGWQIKHNPAFNYNEVVTDGTTGIGGGIFQAPEQVPPYVTVYVQVDDLQAYLTKAESLGGKTCVPPMPIPGVGSIAMFQDLDGHAIGLFKPETGPA